MNGNFDLVIDSIPVGRDIAFFPDKEHGDFGVYVGNVPSDAELKQFVADGEDQLACLKIQDNGRHGDGCWLDLRCTTRDEPLLVSFLLPDSSIEPLIAALQAVVQLRQAESGGKIAAAAKQYDANNRE